MLYSAYQLQQDLAKPVQAGADLLDRLFALAPREITRSLPVRQLRAAGELVSRTRVTHDRPAFSIATVDCGEGPVEVHERVVLKMPFATLLHFVKESSNPQPTVLVVAPLAGHFSTLLRDTIASLLVDHDVFLIDWSNARDVPLDEGSFDLDSYIDYVIRCVETVGPETHLVAVCQPCVPVAAVAVMAEDDHPLQPSSMTLMAGPVDTRENPTRVNEFSKALPFSYFENSLIDVVPMRYRGAGRRVYPGFVQLSGFVQMNLGKHIEAHRQLFEALVDGDVAKAESTKAFYDEYFAVLDLPADFYLQTVDRVFQRDLLAKGQFPFKGRIVDPRAIRKTALLTVEGDRDDICGVGQTLAAHALCEHLKPYKKRHLLQIGVGHYGVFSGRTWRQKIYPVVKSFVLANS